MKYIKYALFCFLIAPVVVSANKYTLKGKNTKAEVEALGLEIRNASMDIGKNAISAKSANVLTFEIRTQRFRPCKQVSIGVTLFMPPNGVIFSGALKENKHGHFEFVVRNGEEDGVLISVICPNKSSYAFSLVE